MEPPGMSSSPRDEHDRPTFPIERRNLGSDVYRVLRDRILKREMHPGEKLSDLRLSSELGVSRTPIREALHQLVQDGVVVAEPNRGFFVATFTPADLEEIFDLRCALEAFAMRKVAANDFSREYKRALEGLDRVAGLIATADTDEKRLAAANAFLEVDRGFHSWMVEHAGNQRLTTIVTGLWAQIAVFQKAGTEIPGWMEIATEQHRRIVELLLAKDVDAAVAALEDHILDMKTRVLADLTSGDADEGPLNGRAAS
jgi:DNA-binding GntR family transcriptional regulator